MIKIELTPAPSGSDDLDNPDLSKYGIDDDFTYDALKENQKLLFKLQFGSDGPNYENVDDGANLKDSIKNMLSF